MEITPDIEIINTVLGTQRQRTSILAPMERMNEMTRVLTVNFPTMTRDEAANHVAEYAARAGMASTDCDCGAEVEGWAPGCCGLGCPVHGEMAP